MELKDFLEIGAQKAGSLTELGRMLGISQPNMSKHKAHRAIMPMDAIVRLAEYIDADLKALIAANELVTERKEAKRQFWMPFVSSKRAAAIFNMTQTETALEEESRHLVGRGRFELPTNGLKVRCSTN